MDRLAHLQLAQIDTRVGILEGLEGDSVGLGDIVGDVAALNLVLGANTRALVGRGTARGDGAEFRGREGLCRRVSGDCKVTRESDGTPRRSGDRVGVETVGLNGSVGVDSPGSGLHGYIRLVGGRRRLRAGDGTFLVAAVEQNHQEHRHMGAENEGGDAEGGFALGGLFQFGARQQRGIGGAHGVRRIDGASWVEDWVLSDPYRTGSSTRVDTKVSAVLIERTGKR